MVAVAAAWGIPDGEPFEGIWERGCGPRALFFSKGKRAFKRAQFQESSELVLCHSVHL